MSSLYKTSTVNLEDVLNFLVGKSHLVNEIVDVVLMIEYIHGNILILSKRMSCKTGHHK